MKIAIIGATGMAGQAIYKEAIARGHDVTGIVRNAEKAKELLGDQAKLLLKDALSLQKEDLTHFEVVVNAFATAPNMAYQHVDLAAKLVAFFRVNRDATTIFYFRCRQLACVKWGNFLGNNSDDARSRSLGEHSRKSIQRTRIFEAC